MLRAAVPLPTAGAAEARSFEVWFEQELAAAVGAFVALEHDTVRRLRDPAADREPTRLEHGFTGVLPEHRRRAWRPRSALAQIAWAAERGYEELVTTTGVSNTALRRQKAKLGYDERDGPSRSCGAPCEAAPGNRRSTSGCSFGAHLPTWVVMAVYLVRELHFSPLQLVLMGTAMEAAVFLCEVPTGVVADTYSRRLSLIIGYLGMGVAWAAVGLVSAPWLIIALWALWGLSYTFTSGAEQAWITDEVGVANVGTRLPARRALRAGRRGARAACSGRGRRRLAAGGRDPRRRLHDRLWARLPRLHARARLPPAAARGARIGARRAADDRRPRARATPGPRRRSCS